MKIISSFSKDELRNIGTDKFLKNISKEAFSKNKVIFKICDTAKNGEGFIRLKIFSPHSKLSISAIVSIIDNLGFDIVDIVTSARDINHLKTEKKLYIYCISIKFKCSGLVFNSKLYVNLEEGLDKIWSNTIENDTFNSLICCVGLNYRETNLLRAYAKYLKQVNFEFSIEHILDVLLKYSSLTRNILELFNIKFNPSLDNRARATQEKKLQTTIDDQLSEISVFDDDKILATYLNIISDTKRTNFFVTDKNSQYKDFISLKIYLKELRDIPLPKPEVDTFVYSAKFEAIHLRGGKIARGGIRWADSLEGFRKVILDLMKTQITKNAIIVPSGCKGGFVVKQESKSREDYFKCGIECYKNFLKGVLDITDNIVNGQIVHPTNVVRYDEDDTYFVVAADKGTATFSDFANEISKEYNFWLGDAFASGGSNGYNHKEMGITAKGTWVCVKEHFRNIPIDPDKDEFTVVGIGDMSGDVFGNSMLLSRKMKLVAAFNHIHIFLDPNPDPETSFKERKRLFDKPQSQWLDYNKDLISKGGGIYSRSLKSIPISAEVKKVLDITADHLSPSELIKTILKAPVDLLWNGGIGTYVKGKDEKDSDIVDRANDNLRVLGQQLRCKVVGEGGNLGFTQKGRIEYAKNGGRINTDFIDNSGGVNCSDYEVNIKIALGHAVQAKQITPKERDGILAKCKEKVEKLSFESNRKQSQTLDMECDSKMNTLADHATLINQLEERGELQREVENLPTQKEIEEMRNNGERLTRPEIAVLLLYAKNSMAKILSSYDFIKEDKFFEDTLLSYFPEYLQQNFKDAILSHKLSNEIIINVITNDLINALGCTISHNLMEVCGYEPIMIVQAFYIAKHIIHQIIKYLNIQDNVVDESPKNLCGILKVKIIRILNYYPKITEINDFIKKGYRKDFKDILNLMVVHFKFYQEIYKETNCLEELPEVDICIISFIDIIMISKKLNTDISKVAPNYFKIRSLIDFDAILSLLCRNQDLSHFEHLARFEVTNQLCDLMFKFIKMYLQKQNQDKLEEILKKFKEVTKKTTAKRDKQDKNFVWILVLIKRLERILQMHYDETP